MSTRAALGSFFIVLTIVAARPDVAQGAPCVVACRDEVTACVSTECQGLVKRPLRRCRQRCKRTVVHDCFADLSVCGATIARPPKPPTGGGGSTGGGW